MKDQEKILYCWMDRFVTGLRNFHTPHYAIEYLILCLVLLILLPINYSSFRCC